MRISSQPDPLTAEERRQVRNFFKEVLTNGYATWPIERGKVTIYINGSIRRIYSDSRWNIGEDYIYIGRSRDEGVNDFAAPSNRLACIVALMGACDMQNDPVLIGLVEKRLAKILAGVYESAIAPLAQRSNKEPIARMAWSPAGGVAAWVDGKWASPITGEEVTLKVEEGWVVVETGEGRAVPEMPAPNVQQRVSEDMEVLMQRFIEGEAYHTETLPDGRRWVRYQDGTGERGAQNEISNRGYSDQLIAERHPDGRWGITYPRVEVPAVPEGRVLLREDFDRWEFRHRFILTQTEDGRPIVAYSSYSEWEVREYCLPAAQREGGLNVEVTQNTEGSWGIAPVWGPAPSTGQAPEPNAEEQLLAAIEAAVGTRTHHILPDGRIAYTCGTESRARELLENFRQAETIPQAVVDRVDGMWGVVSRPMQEDEPIPF